MTDGPLRSVVAALALALVASGAEAGYRLVSRDGEQMLVSNGRVKEMAAEGEGPQSVFDLGTARAWMSNPDRKVYWEGTIDDLCTTLRDTATKMKESMHQSIEAQLAKLPPESRAKVEELRKNLAAKRAADEEKKPKKPGVIAVEKTGETTKIAGQPTRKYRVTVDGELYEEDWLTTDPALAREFALDKASALMSRVSACAQASEPQGPAAKGIDEGAIYKKLYPEGWPLRAVSHAGGKTSVKSEIEKVEKENIPDHEFAPPAGYTQGALTDVMFSGRGGETGESQ